MEGQEDAHASTKTGWTKVSIFKFSYTMYRTLHPLEFCTASDLQLPISGVQSVTAWDCSSIRARVVSANAQGMVLLA
jgi:hypothetical protein